MAKRSKDKRDNTEYEHLREALAAGRPEKLYVFYGEEHYLLEHYLGRLRRLLAGNGFSEFNHKKFAGQSISVDELTAACDTLPAFAERTLIEVHDFDMFKAGEDAREKLIALITDLPDYVCLVFIYDTVEYAPDGRLKLAALLKKEARIVEFAIQEQSQLVKWIKRHFIDGGKSVETKTAEYLAFITGGLMTTLNTEIEKLCSYARGSTVTREDIDAVVTPVLEANVYKLTDHLFSGRFDEAARVLIDLISMREPPHKIIFTVTLKLRQLLAARLCYEQGLGERNLMKLCNIKYDFQARNLMSSARRTSLERCRDAVILSASAAYRMNSGGDPETVLTELLLDLAVCYGRTR